MNKFNLFNMIMGVISIALFAYIMDHVFPDNGTSRDDTKELINAAIDPVGTMAPEIAEFAIDTATYIAVPEKRHEIATKPIQKYQERLETKLERLKESGHIDEYNRMIAGFKKQLFDIAKHKQGVPFELTVLLEGDFDIDINMQDEKQRTLLFYATANKNAYLVRYLLSDGADPEIRDYVNLRPIDLVDKQKDRDIYLSFHHIEVTKEAQSSGLSNVQATYTYDQQNNIITTKVVGEQQSSWTPLMMAINDNRSIQAKQYINRGDDLEAQTNNGSTALFFAIKHHNNALVDMLLAHGANIEHRNRFRMSPLALAIRLDNLYAVKALIKAGVNTHGICASSRTPVKYAEINRRDRIARYLKSVGAS